jgi:hypothetical protein
MDVAPATDFLDLAEKGRILLFLKKKKQKDF